jgi:hypothetical protein
MGGMHDTLLKEINSLEGVGMIVGLSLECS